MLFPLILVLICIVFGAFGQIAMKNGMTQIGKIDSIVQLISPGMLSKMVTNGYVIGGLLLYFIAAFLWLGALSKLEVSFMYPLLSLGYVLTAILAFIIFRENVTLVRWAGIALIVGGCFLISRT